MKKQANLIISGLVQGVSFRYYTKEKASSLGITGWTANMADGKVEIVVEGEEDKLEELIIWCSTGSPSARVDEIKLSWEDFQGEFALFEIK